MVTTMAVANEVALNNPDLGSFLLKLARDTITSGKGFGKCGAGFTSIQEALEIGESDPRVTKTC